MVLRGRRSLPLLELTNTYTFFQPLMNNVWPISTIKWLLKQSMAFKTISQNLMNNWQQLFNSLHLFSSIWPSKTVCKCFNQFRSYYDNCDSFMNNYTELLNSFQNCSTVCKTIKQAFLWRKIIFFFTSTRWNMIKRGHSSVLRSLILNMASMTNDAMRHQPAVSHPGLSSGK